MKIKRRGVSEVLASILMVVITLILAIMMAAFVRLDAGTSAEQLVNVNQNNVGYLNEQFTIPLVYFPTSTIARVFIQNSGSIALQINSIDIYTPVSTTLDVMFNSAGAVNENNPTCTGTVSTTESPSLGTTSSDFILSRTGISIITLTLPSCVSTTFNVNVTYCILAIGRYGEAVNICAVDKS